MEHYANLAPRYTKGGYQLCMEWFSEKYLQKGESLLSRKISLEATLHHIKRREADLEMEFSQKEFCTTSKDVKQIWKWIFLRDCKS
jgi:hypothetical protein